MPTETAKKPGLCEGCGATDCAVSVGTIRNRGDQTNASARAASYCDECWEIVDAGTNGAGAVEMERVHTVPPLGDPSRGHVFVLRSSTDGEEEWFVDWRGGLIAASWSQRGPAAAHLDQLQRGVAKPLYRTNCEPTPLYRGALP